MSSENVSFGHKESLCPIIVAVAALLCMSPELHADSFVMKSGKVIDGTIADGSEISVFIKDREGLLKSIMVADIVEVQVGLKSGAQVVGRLAGFRDDVYEIETDEWTLYIKDGQVVQSVVVYDEATPSIVPNAGGPAIGIETPEPPTEPSSTNESDMLKRAPL